MTEAAFSPSNVMVHAFLSGTIDKDTNKPYFEGDFGDANAPGDAAQAFRNYLPHILYNQVNTTSEGCITLQSTAKKLRNAVAAARF